MIRTTRVMLRTLALVVLLLAGGGIAVANGAASAWMATMMGKTSTFSHAPAAPTPLVGTLPAGVVPGQFTTEQFISPDGTSMTYYIYVPKNYSPTASYPLVLLLHGGGERSKIGNSAGQNRAILLSQQYVQDWIAPAVQQKWPSFVLVPQVPGSARWVDVAASQGSYSMHAQPSLSLQLAMDILVTVQRAYPAVNTSRAYLTGLSMGGYGAWEAAERWPAYFAAVVPLAGGGDPSHARALVNLPVWAFHGSADTAVPVSGSRQMIAAIQAGGGSPRYTEYAGKDHGIWNSERIYANSSLLTWLFSQTRAPKTAAASCQHPLGCPS